jgi:hypothetical protein
MDFPNEASVLTNENLQDGERVKYAYFDAVDVVARPTGMELKGAPLPSAASELRRGGVVQVMIGVFAIGASLVLLSPFG